MTTRLNEIVKTLDYVAGLVADCPLDTLNQAIAEARTIAKLDVWEGLTPSEPLASREILWALVYGFLSMWREYKYNVPHHVPPVPTNPNQKRDS